MVTIVFDIAIPLCRKAIELAIIIRDSQRADSEMVQTTDQLTKHLAVAGSLLERLKKMVDRVNELYQVELIAQIHLLTNFIRIAITSLESAKKDRNILIRLFKANDTKRKLEETNKHLYEITNNILQSIPKIEKVLIPKQEFQDFRRTFSKAPIKDLIRYCMINIKDSCRSNIEVDEVQQHSMDQLNEKSCYLSILSESIYYSHQLKTWAGSTPKCLLASRLERFRASFRQRPPSDMNNTNNSNFQPLMTFIDNGTEENLSFIEFFVSADDICGMCITKNYIYIATKFEITILSYSQQILGQFGSSGTENNTFLEICYLYTINDMLFVIDQTQCSVQQFKIDNNNNGKLEFIKRYQVIADISEKPTLESCVYFSGCIFVSDSANECLHIFREHANKQVLYLCGSALTPFCPTKLCCTDRYLYVSNEHSGHIGVLVFDIHLTPVDWFTNSHLESRILSIDICKKKNELFLLTTKDEQSATTGKSSWPQLWSMNASVRTV
ncbi:unnamed protein product [Didymodactylos carnosus]|uniref:Uncharacterized protein n=1 Tax=Didymodactylos carnosus TaxID=1234261 RepID=A0A814HDW2_9BILA|nr:unnamed protein product [Didymodactylos carnosus]CAF3779308.1 unnamed protein product [Didymodactylos carnosus]